MKVSKRVRYLVVLTVVTICLFLVSGCSIFNEERISEEEMELLETKLKNIQSEGAITESVCGKFEIYEGQTDTCHPQKKCKTTTECATLGDQLAEQIIERFGDLLTDYEFSDEGDSYFEQVLARYELEGDLLTNPEFLVVDDGLESYRDDVEKHVRIWNMFTNLIPESERQMLSGFHIMTDGNEETLAQVEPDDEDLSKWWLSMDILDSKELFISQTTLLHEFAHLLTLQDSQMDMNEEVVFSEDDDEIHETAPATCQYFFVDGMGCMKEDSMLQAYIETFWLDVLDEWEERGVAEDEDVATEFFMDYEDQFVTDYAVTSPVEDIAEVWAYFILSPKNDGDEIWLQKISFFYQFPDQVKLRAEILSRLLSYLSQNELHMR
ncbi:hypothetical protein ACXYMX_07775 [Sporosarcina sp. CAU 1771]